MVDQPMIQGVNVHAQWDEQSDPLVRKAIRDQLVRAGMTSVRIDTAWDQIQHDGPDQWYWGKLDDLVDEYAAAGMTVLLMLYWPPAWASKMGSSKKSVPDDPADFGRVCGEAAKRFGDKLVAVELWNEPDLAAFWAGTRTQYAELLRGAYPLAKQIAPNGLFLAAAPTYLGLGSGWFADMYTHDSYRPGVSYDAQAIHPYMSASDLPPTAPASDYSIHGIARLQELRASHGDVSPLWATEFGWSSHDGGSEVDPWKRGVTELEQAAYTLGAYILLQSYGVVGAWVYTDRDVDTSDPHEASFGLLHRDNSPKLVADLLAKVAAAERPPAPPDEDLEQRVTALEDEVAALSTRVVHLEDTNTALSDALLAAAAVLETTPAR